MTVEPILEVKGLKKYFPVYSGVFRHEVGNVKAVNGVDFKIYPGEVLGLVGESGSGKSTVGRTAIALTEASAGEIIFEGKKIDAMDPKALKVMRREMQIIFQDPYASLNPRRTVGDSIVEGLVYHGFIKSHQEKIEHISKILQKVGLPTDAMNRYPHEFSGGQQQRICIGRAISLNPKLIICDEAVSALDISIQAQIINLFIDLKEKMGLSFLFITHDLSVVRVICDRVIVMYLGKVMEEGTTDEVFDNPKHPYTQAMLAAEPVNHPGEKKHRMILKGEIPSPLNPPSGCPFRTRCPYAQKICAETPPTKKIGESHIYHCILD